MRLSRRRRLPAATAMGIEAGQQRKTYPAGLSRGDDAPAGLGWVGIARSVRRIVQVVELADAGEARLQHLHVGPRRHRFDVVGRHGREEAIHHLAPGPEAVVVGPAPLHQPRHGALEGMAVHIGDTGHGNARRSAGRLALAHGRRDGRDGPPVDGDQDVAPPSLFEQRPPNMDLEHDGLPYFARILCEAGLASPVNVGSLCIDIMARRGQRRGWRRKHLWRLGDAGGSALDGCSHRDARPGAPRSRPRRGRRRRRARRPHRLGRPPFRAAPVRTRRAHQGRRPLDHARPDRLPHPPCLRRQPRARVRASPRRRRL